MKHSSHLIIQAAATLVLLTSTSKWAVAQSFDCAKASTRIEATICSTPRVAALDAKMGRLFKKKLDSLSGEPREKAAEGSTGIYRIAKPYVRLGA